MTASPRSLSSIPFGAFLAYSPKGRGQSAESEKSRSIAYGIKNAKAGYIELVVRRLAEELQPGKSAALLRDYFGRNILVIPCPGSAPLVRSGLWTPKAICDELVKKGLAARCAPILRRVAAVPRSSTAPRGERPTPARHIQSMEVASQLEFAPRDITIVDDIVTRGATLIAAVTLIRRHFPAATVRAFGVVRTLSYEPETNRILDPVVGTISVNGSDVRRNP